MFGERGLGASGAGSVASLVPPSTPASHHGAESSAGGDRRGNGPRAATGASTIQNFGKDNENQDAYITSATSTGTKCFVGVFDGHGEKGKRMSNFARSHLAKSLFAHQDIHTDPKNALERAYMKTQEEIERLHGSEAHQSGTTAVAAYQHRDRLLVANVGDSRAVLGRVDTARKNYSAVDLSSDHKPSRPDERERVTKAGGVVDQMAFPIMHNGAVRWIRGGPERVMDKNGMGGLAMSRSLGDLSLRPYITAQPEIYERRLDSRDKVLVLGSDGVWDHVSSQEAVDIAGRHADPNQAAREITSVARRRWQKETDGMMSDDITAVVVKLDNRSPPGSSERATASRGGGSSPASVRSNLGRTTATGFGLDRAAADRAALTNGFDRSSPSSSYDRAGGATGTIDPARRTTSHFGRGRSAAFGGSPLHSSGAHGGPRAPEMLPAAGRRSSGVR